MIRGFYFFVVCLGAAVQALAEPIDKRTKVVPELTYRQAHLQERKGATFHRDVDKNYADQIYMSLKLVKTHKYVNEIVIEPAVRTNRTDPGLLEATIDQGYMAAGLGAFRLTAGKKAEYEGVGYFVNPSDLLNEDKEQFDPLYRREGKSFTRLKWGSDEFNLAIGYVPTLRKSSEDGKLWLQGGAQIAEVDLRWQYTYNRNDESTIGLGAARFFGDIFELHLDTRFQQRQRSAELEGERIIFDCDAIASVVSSYQSFIEENEGYDVDCVEDPEADQEAGSFYTVLGTRVVFSPRRTLVLEGIQNQGGLTGEEQEIYYQYIRLQRDAANQQPDPQTRIIGRQYWFAVFQDEETFKSTSMNLSYLYSQDDGSAFVNTEVKYALNPLMSLSFVNSQFAGERGTEFGEAPAVQVNYLILRGKF